MSVHTAVFHSDSGIWLLHMQVLLEHGVSGASIQPHTFRYSMTMMRNQTPHSPEGTGSDTPVPEAAEERRTHRSDRTRMCHLTHGRSEQNVSECRAAL